MLTTTEALVIYGTRYGATASTSETIAEELRKKGLEVTVVDARKERIRDIAQYSLIVVGSGMQIDRWTGAAEGFLKRFKEELRGMKVALFVSSGVQVMMETEADPTQVNRGRRKYLEEKAEEHGLNPIALGLFGGVWDFNRLPVWVRVLPAAKESMNETRRKLAAAGIRETMPGVYDTRDWEAIRLWAREVAEKVGG